MIGEHSGEQAPDRKISEALLDFASPLLAAAGPESDDSRLEPILRLACTIWNAVAIDTIKGDTRFVDEIRRSAAGEPGVVALVEQLLMRKQTLFATDSRLIGNYELNRRDGQLILRAEARDPRGVLGEM